MKALLLGYSLFIACFICVMSQRLPGNFRDFEPSGRRGDVLTLDDVGDQTVFNVDNRGGGGGGGGGGGKGGKGLDCDYINRVCQCNRPPGPIPPGPGPVPPGPGPVPPIPGPTGQYQMDYDTFSNGYLNG